MMAKIEIYTTNTCSYCAAAKMLLQKKGAKYDEIDVTYDTGKRQQMTARAGGRRSVPQIFIGEMHVGGCDDLHALESKSALDALLASA
jgi:glutaredoxin 3